MEQALSSAVSLDLGLLLTCPEAWEELQAQGEGSCHIKADDFACHSLCAPLVAEEISRVMERPSSGAERKRYATNLPSATATDAHGLCSACNAFKWMTLSHGTLLYFSRYFGGLFVLCTGTHFKQFTPF